MRTEMSNRQLYKILLAGLETSFGESVRSSFDNIGVICDSAFSFETGIRAIENGSYKAAIINGDTISGPGTKFCSYIRSHTRFARIRIIFMTASFRSASLFINLTEELHSDLIIGNICDPEYIVEIYNRLSAPVKKHSSDPEEDEMFASLRAEYPSIFYERLKTIDRLLAAIALNPGDPALLTELRSCVHKINGAAGSYGYPGVSAAAAQWEAFLDDLIKAHVYITPNKEDALHSFNDKIKICYQLDRLRN